VSPGIRSIPAGRPSPAAGDADTGAEPDDLMMRIS
jgi:hypothetical protein